MATIKINFDKAMAKAAQDELWAISTHLSKVTPLSNKRFVTFFL